MLIRSFFFAPAYHPAFKHIAPVRKQLAEQGRRSVFNILGPLINPGRPAHALLGAFSPAWVPRLAGALEELGVQAGLTAHGVIAPGKGIDELTTATVNEVQGTGRLAGVSGQWRAADFGLCGPGFELPAPPAMALIPAPEGSIQVEADDAQLSEVDTSILRGDVQMAQIGRAHV